MIIDKLIFDFPSISLHHDLKKNLNHGKNSMIDFHLLKSQEFPPLLDRQQKGMSLKLLWKLIFNFRKPLPKKKIR